MIPSIYDKIRNNNKYPELVARRRRLSWLLSAIVLVSFFVFVLFVGFAPQILATPIAEGSATPIAIPLSVAMIIGYWLLTGFYNRRVRRLDELNDQLLREVRK